MNYKTFKDMWFMFFVWSCWGNMCLRYIEAPNGEVLGGICYLAGIIHLIVNVIIWSAKKAEVDNAKT